MFTHLGVVVPGTGHPVGVPDFQVRKTLRTWNDIRLTVSEFVFQVRRCSRT